MATIVLPRIRPTSTPPPLSTPNLNINTSSKSAPVAVPNKHLPVCSVGRTPIITPETPPASPPKHLGLETLSILYPPDRFPVLCESPRVYSIDADGLSAALNHIASQPLPDPKLVFPWLHGLHSENHIQLSFFVARRKALRKTPACLRGITLVKCGGDLTCSKLKGALAPDELIANGRNAGSGFIDVDPKEGFSVRNFQIQAGKMAMLSDIVIYGDHTTKKLDLLRLAKDLSKAQALWKSNCDMGPKESREFSTFVVSSPFENFENSHPELVATDSKGKPTGQVMDFFQWERVEMCSMSKPSEIAHNVWLGPTPDASITSLPGYQIETRSFDVFIEASDLAQVPQSSTLAKMANVLEQTDEPQYMDFPSSGSIVAPSWSQSDADGILETCKWIYELANPREDGAPEMDCDGDSTMACRMPTPRRILVHCADGYTESSMLGLAYYMYAEGVSIHEAWLQLHCDKERNFFAYPSDVALLAGIQARLLEQSPFRVKSPAAEPDWLGRMDGSLPSRILSYMYLGNLPHANNPELLKALGVCQVLSIGESVSWSASERQEWGSENLLFIDRVQDNGVDPLTDEFDRCLEFIERGKLNGTATLVHCRVGVSRSATICIAEVMNSLHMSFPRAYCYVRARRLNVIIQPHLRFAYELLKWEEYQQTKHGQGIKRELEWATIAREIALMNRPYSR